MSIAKTAPLKFDLQDLVCVALMLRFCSVAPAQFYVEPKDGEDATLILPSGSSGQVIEIQVKGAEGPVTLASVAACLVHTPDRSFENTLLERLVNDPDRLVILVMSGRCDDTCAHFTAPLNWSVAAHKSGQISAAHATTLVTAFSTAPVSGKETAKLNPKRKAHNAEIATALDGAVVQQALHRLIVLERIDGVALESLCGDVLRRDHRIPNDRVPDVINRLRDAIKTAKAASSDAFPLLRDVLQAAAPARIRPDGYVGRGVETELAAELSDRNLLLLTGTPRVGKSWTGQDIAARFEEHGYEIKKFQSVEEAERFLQDSSAGARLALLDDPFGGVIPVGEATQALSRLKSLGHKLAVDRKLIVAQERDRLLSTAHLHDLKAVSIAGRHWHEFDAGQPAFLAEIWRRFANDSSVPSQLRDVIFEWLADGSLNVEPGCLLHLSSNHERLPVNPSLDQVARLAREGAMDLALALATGATATVLPALAQATTHDVAIAPATLAYILGSGGELLPTRRDVVSTVTFGLDPSGQQAFPEYASMPVLTPDQEASLETLERRRVLILPDSNTISFSHPFYRAAAETLIDSCTTAKDLDRVMTVLQRGLFCRVPATSRAVARNLDWLLDKLASRSGGALGLVDIAIEGLKSFFPTTRDICFRFLLRHLDSMSSGQREAFPGLVSGVTSVALRDLHWTDGEAHLSFKRETSFFLSALGETAIDVSSELALLNDPAGGYLSPERAANALNFLKSGADLSEHAMGRLLSYDETALRAQAAWLWLREPRNQDQVIVERIFADDHPSISVAALNAAAWGWNGYDSGRRESVSQGLIAFASQLPCAVAMIKRLEVFDRPERMGEDPPWDLFAALMAECLATLPYNAPIDEARLYTAITRSKKHLNPDQVVRICDSWIGWIERNADKGILLDDYGLGVISVLIEGTEDVFDLREGRVARLLEVKGTGAQLRLITDLITYWDDLTDAERVVVGTRISGGGKDERWLKAVALTRDHVPEILERAILGSDLKLDDGADAIMSRMAPELLTAALHVYMGKPQPLWFIATHHGGESTWEPIIELIARQPSHPLFDLAWDHIAAPGNDVRLAAIIGALGPEHVERCLEVLLRLTVSWNSEFFPAAWETLFSLAKDDAQRAGWMDKILPFTPNILNDLSELRGWLTADRDFNDMFDRLARDSVPILMLDRIFRKWSGPRDIDLDAKTLHLFGVLVAERPPQLNRTYDLLSDLVPRDRDETDKLQALLEEKRLQVLDDMTSVRASVGLADLPLECWQGPR